MADPLAAIHKAIYTALNTAMSIDVYDYVPQNASYPYVEIERSVASSEDSLVAQKDNVFTFVTIWSDYKGQKEILEQMETAYAALHRQKLALDNGNMVECMVQMRDTSRDVNDKTFIGSLTVRSLVEH